MNPFRLRTDNLSLLPAPGALLVALAFLGGCGDDDETDDNSAQVSEAAAAMADNYANIVSASYADTATTAQALVDATDAFVTAPSETTLATARQAWLAAREPYLQTEVYRFYDGPIDNPTDGPEGLLNAWPLDEAYIDYVQGNESAGIVQDDSVSLSADALLALNEQGGDENIATGYHAIEFLLWGQDFNADGPGDRPFTDFVQDEENPFAARRAEYLTIVSDLLLAHLTEVNGEWDAAGTDNYRSEFLAADPMDALRRVMTGMVILAGFETGGERLQAALDSGNQEDEHSCFSDNTHRDMIQDIQGVQNVWTGRYVRTDGTTISGTGVRAVVEIEDAELATEIDQAITASLGLANALNVPFDQEIALSNTEGRERVTALILSLRDLEGLLQDAFRGFDLDVPVAE